jgi:hypothetical protein
MWLKIDDGFAEDERVLGLSDKAFRLHVAALCACARNLTDGVLSLERVRALKALTGAKDRDVAELAASGLWEGSGPWSIRKYLEYNPSKADAEAKREAQRQGGKRGAEHRWGDRSTHGSTHRSTHGSTHVSPHDDSNSPVPVPVPVPVEDPPSSRSVAREDDANGGAGREDIDFENILRDVDPSPSARAGGRR